MPERDVGAEWGRIFQQDRDCPAWLSTELASAAPLELRLSWGSGATRTENVMVTHTGLTRFRVWAHTLTIEARTLTETSTVKVRTGPGGDPTSNVWEVRESTPGGGLYEGDIPFYAVAVRLDLSTTDAIAAAKLELLDHNGAVLAAIPASAAREDVPVGTAVKVRVTSQAAFRLVYRLPL